jgi:hypothetical protein
VQLYVYSGIGFSGSGEQDIRNFVVPDPDHGIVFPPYQMLPPKLPLPGTGSANEKPDELNIGGQPFGWDGFGNEGLVLEFMRKTVAGDFGGGGGSTAASFKRIPAGSSKALPTNSLTLLEGRTVVDGYLTLDGHMRIIGRRQRPQVLPVVGENADIPNNCVVPVNPKNGPFTLTLRPRGVPGETVELFSVSDALAPPTVTVFGNGPLIAGAVSRQLTTSREYLRLRRLRGHGWMVG